MEKMSLGNCCVDTSSEGGNDGGGGGGGCNEIDQNAEPPHEVQQYVQLHGRGWTISAQSTDRSERAGCWLVGQHCCCAVPLLVPEIQRCTVIIFYCTPFLKFGFYVNV